MDPAKVGTAIVRLALCCCLPLPSCTAIVTLVLLPL